MRLYLADGEHPLQRAYQTLVVLAEDEQAALRIIAHEVQGFRIDQMQAIRDYKQLDTRPAVVARITLPRPD